MVVTLCTSVLKVLSLYLIEHLTVVAEISMVFFAPGKFQDSTSGHDSILPEPFQFISCPIM